MYANTNGCSKSNAFYYIMLVHKVRGRHYWHGRICWIFPPIFHVAVRQTSADRHSWQNSVWHGSTYEAKICNSIPSFRKKKKMHPFTLISTCWTFVETKQWMWAQWGSGWSIPAVVMVTQKISHVPDSNTQMSHHKMENDSVNTSTQIGGLWSKNCVQNWISASMCCKQWWQL